MAGARTVRYKVPTDAYFDDENRRTACYPMVETAAALRDLAEILKSPLVDGIFVGPSDLSLTRGRGSIIAFPARTRATSRPSPHCAKKQENRG